MMREYHGTSATESLYNVNLVNASHDQSAVVMVTPNYILGCCQIKLVQKQACLQKISRPYWAVMDCRRSWGRSPICIFIAPG